MTGRVLRRLDRRNQRAIDSLEERHTARNARTVRRIRFRTARSQVAVELLVTVLGAALCAWLFGPGSVAVWLVLSIPGLLIAHALGRAVERSDRGR